MWLAISAYVVEILLLFKHDTDFIMILKHSQALKG